MSSEVPPPAAKSVFSSLTIWGLVTTLAGVVGVPAIDAKATTTALVLQIAGIVLALIGRYRKGDLKLPLTKGAAAALLAVSFLVLGGCKSIPYGRVEFGGFGFSAAVDTRPIVGAVGGIVTTVGGAITGTGAAAVVEGATTPRAPDPAGAPASEVFK